MEVKWKNEKEMRHIKYLDICGLIFEKVPFRDKQSNFQSHAIPRFCIGSQYN